MNYKNMRFIENFNVGQFPTAGEYNIPVLMPYNYEPTEFIGFNFARSTKNKKEKGIHFFIDDYQFERLWREPLKYINLIGEFHSIMTRDFSLYTDFPKALQILQSLPQNVARCIVAKPRIQSYSNGCME